MDKERLLESAKKFGIEIEFDVDNPGVHDENSGSFFTFEELLGDIFHTERTFDKNRLNKDNKILYNNTKDRSMISKNIEYSVDDDKYNTLPIPYDWVA